jgi:hypothetical protein
MILDSMPPELRAVCTVGVMECSAEDIPPEVIAQVERIRGQQTTRKKLDDMMSGKAALDRDLVVRTTNEHAERMGIDVRAVIKDDGKLGVTDTKGKELDPRAVFADLQRARARMSFDQKIDLANTAETRGDQTCVCRYEIRKKGKPFAGCYDPRVVLKDDALPEGDYEVFFFCTCGDPKNSGMFGLLRLYGDGIGVLKGPEGMVWTRDG